MFIKCFLKELTDGEVMREVTMTTKDKVEEP